jgi:predicted RNA-binding protein with PIN domain
MPYLIDGNNLLGSWGGRALPGDGRLEVLRRVAEFCRVRGARATIVFDGAPLRPDRDAQHLGPIVLRFPPEGGDADSVIREIIDRTPRPAELVVVSSDKALYSYARTRGASALRAREWTALSRRTVAGGTRSTSAARSEKPEREVDVEGWLRRFSHR